MFPLASYLSKLFEDSKDTYSFACKIKLLEHASKILLNRGLVASQWNHMKQHLFIWWNHKIKHWHVILCTWSTSTRSACPQTLGSQTGSSSHSLLCPYSLSVPAQTRLTADKTMRLLLTTFGSLREELLHMQEDLRVSAPPLTTLTTTRGWWRGSHI